MRVVILAGSVPITTFIDALINVMAEEGLKMTIIGKRTGHFKYHKNVDVVLVPSNRPGQFLFIIKNIVRCRLKDIKKIFDSSAGIVGFFYDLLFYLPIINAKPDKIHIQWAAILHGHDLLFDLFPDKILLSLRGAHINYKPITHPEIKETYIKLFPEIHRFHAVSNDIGMEALKYAAAKGKIQTIYSYVDDEIVNIDISPKEKGLLKIISVGRFIWIKGYDYALDALGILKQRKVDFEYTIVAQGTIPDSIIFQIDQLGLKDNVIIVNGLAHNEVIKKIKESDLLLLSSLDEGVANVALEAMAVGTPVITTDCGGMDEVIINNVSGIIVNNRDSAAMADALGVFNEMTPEERYSLALAAKKRIRDFHNKSLFVKEFSAFYKL